MTIALATAAALSLGHAWCSRERRAADRHRARERRRDEREQQWREMIEDARGHRLG